MFAIATEALSAEKHLAFVYAMPILRRIKLHLSRNDLFLKDCVSEDVKQFYERYGEETFISSVLSTLETIRFGLLNDFTTRFNNMTIDILWTTILDPRCLSLKHLIPSERDIANKL